MQELRNHIKTLAQEEGKTELEIITELQAGCAKLGDENSLEILCKLKVEYINV